MTASVRSMGHRLRLLAAVAATAVTLLAAKWLDDLSADPVAEKDCLPLEVQPPAPALPLAAITPAPDRALPWTQVGGTVNDASCLNSTPVYGVVRVRTEEDVRQALAFARSNGLKVSAAGVRHSMGGQAFARGAVVLDMTAFNRMELDTERRLIRVQSGATWHDIQTRLHPRFAVKAMQSTDIFTVGGSISVNAHGMDHRAGSVGGTVRSLRVMLADGTVQTASPTENAELFKLVVGGYGLFGVILDAEIEVTDNAVYVRDQRVVDYRDFLADYRDRLKNNDEVGLFYGHLSTAPWGYLNEMLLYAYRRVEAGDEEVPPLGEVAGVRMRRLVLNLSKRGALPMQAKWWAEKYIEPRLEDCWVSRNQALAEGEACLVSRNQPMHDSVDYLRNRLADETDILQEYFIPQDRFTAFVDGMRTVLTRNGANLLNASVRVVHPEGNFLTYAPGEMFAIVLYLNQPATPGGNAHMRMVTREMVDLTLDSGGTFFLPYQLHYTPEQLVRAYPMLGEFLRLKRSYDPQDIFTSTMYERHVRPFLD